MRFVPSLLLVLAPLTLILGGASCEPGPGERLNRAEELSFQGKHEAAMAEVERALEALQAKTDPESRRLRLEALWTAGRLSHLYLGAPRVALRYYETLVRDYPQRPEAQKARERMARIYVEDLEDRPSSIGLYQALVAADAGAPDAPRWQHEVALGYYAQGKWEQTRTEAQVILDRYPDSDYVDDALFLIGGAFQAEGRLDDAISTYRTLHEKHPASPLVPRAWVEEGNCLAREGRSQEAIDAYIQALARHPDPRSVQVKIARLRSRERATHEEEKAFSHKRH